MIQGVRDQLTTVKRVVKPENPDTGEGAVTVDELHYFPSQGGYCKHTDGNWHVLPPGGSPVRIVGARSAIEHQDGTITVEGPPFKTANGPLRLVAGNWVGAS